MEFQESDYMLIYYTGQCDLENMKELIENKGANVNAFDDEGYSPLHLCCLNDPTTAILRYLLSVGVDVNQAVPETGDTALHLLSQKGDLEKISILLEHLADPFAANNDGYLPQHIAAKNGQTLVIHYFLKYLFETNRENQLANQKSLDFLNLKEKEEKEENKQKDKKEDENSDEEEKEKEKEKVKEKEEEEEEEEEIEKGIEKRIKKTQKQIQHQEQESKIIDYINPTTGESMIHLASENGHLQTIIYLLSEQGKLDLQTKKKETALHLGIKSTNEKIVNELIIRGADLSICNGSSQNAIDLLSENEMAKSLMVAEKCVSKYGDRGLVPSPEITSLIKNRNKWINFYFFAPMLLYLFIGWSIRSMIFKYSIPLTLVSLVIFNFKASFPLPLFRYSHSPVLAGSVFSLITFTFLTSVFQITPMIGFRNSKLLFFIYYCAAATVIISYLLSRYSNPGWIGSKPCNLQQLIEHSRNGMKSENWCSTCRIRKPLRSKHDRYSNKCVSYFDHFCSYTGNAVGQNNYIYLFIFTLFSLISSAMYVILSIIYWKNYIYPRYKLTLDSFQFLLIRKQIFIFLLFIQHLFLLYFEIRMLKDRYQHVTKNLTLNESKNAKRLSYFKFNEHFANPFDLGNLQNWKQYFYLSNKINWYNIMKLSDIPKESINPHLREHIESHNL